MGSDWKAPAVISGIGAILATALIAHTLWKQGLHFSQATKKSAAGNLDEDETDGTELELEDTDFATEVRISKDSLIRRSRRDDLQDPMRAKVYFRTYGCSHNVSDSEFMMGLLVKNGYTLVDTIEESDLCVLNSCTVKNPSQDAASNLAEKADSLQKKVVVTGCVPQADQSVPIFERASLVGVSNITDIVSVVEETLKGNRVVAIGKSKDLPDISSMPKIRRNKLIEIIAISTGCLGQCTYCKTKHARGDLGSYAISTILDRVRLAVSEGVKQIWLTSEDLGAYGLDIGTDIAELLTSLVNEIKKTPEVMLRLGMTNPPYMLQHVECVARILQHPQVFEFLHVPVQSGSNNVLRDMKREYTREDFVFLVEQLLQRVPSLTVASDIICGFPNESDEDHKETVTLIEKFKFPVLNISQFYPRPGTVAARMPHVPTKIAKQRSTEITNLFESYRTTDWLLDREIDVWFDLGDYSDERRNQSVGHTKNYTKVIVPLDPSLPGTKRSVKVSSVHKWHVKGTIVSDE